MRLFVCFGCLLQLSFITCVSLAQRHLPGMSSFIHKRATDVIQTNTDASNIECIHMESQGGELYYTSPGSHEVCGLYLIGLADQLVQITFHDFNIGCEDGGLLAVVDGWEAQGEFFPAESDHERSMEERYRTFCGAAAQPPLVLSSQNVAMLQFRIPHEGQGFRVSISFPHNPQPCHVISLLEEGTYTLSNGGRRANCTLSLLHPERVDALDVNVGHGLMLRRTSRLPGIVTKCAKRNRGDYVEVLGGSGLDPTRMWKYADFCGASSFPLGVNYEIGCPHTVVRLVSSGHYHNSVTFAFRPLGEHELLEQADALC